MKKRFPAIILALALCMGLGAVPALAVTEKELVSMSVTCTAGELTLKEDEFIWVDQAWKRAYYEEGLTQVPGFIPGHSESGYCITDYDGYYVLDSDSVITVANANSAGRDTYIHLSLYARVKHEDGMYWSKTIVKEWPDYIVLENGELKNWTIKNTEEVVLEPGQSIQFSIPSTPEQGSVYNEKTGNYDYFQTTDVIYELEVSKVDWDDTRTDTDQWGFTSTYPTSYQKTFLFKIDDAAVDSALANIAYSNPQPVLLDGKVETFEYYALKDANGNLSNYVKLRDLAWYLNGTNAQFEVEWSAQQGISLSGGKAYTPNGSELSAPFSGSQPYEHLSGKTIVNGKDVELDAISLVHGSYTYYKLRDLGRALGFNVSYINGQIVINTSEPYSDAQ